MEGQWQGPIDSVVLVLVVNIPSVRFRHRIPDLFCSADFSSQSIRISPFSPFLVTPFATFLACPIFAATSRCLSYLHPNDNILLQHL